MWWSNFIWGGKDLGSWNTSSYIFITFLKFFGRGCCVIVALSLGSITYLNNLTSWFVHFPIVVISQQIRPSLLKFYCLFSFPVAEYDYHREEKRNIILEIKNYRADFFQPFHSENSMITHHRNDSHIHLKCLDLHFPCKASKYFITYNLTTCHCMPYHLAYRLQLTLHFFYYIFIEEVLDFCLFDSKNLSSVAVWICSI